MKKLRLFLFEYYMLITFLVNNRNQLILTIMGGDGTLG